LFFSLLGRKNKEEEKKRKRIENRGEREIDVQGISNELMNVAGD